MSLAPLSQAAKHPARPVGLVGFSCWERRQPTRIDGEISLVAPIPAIKRRESSGWQPLLLWSGKTTSNLITGYLETGLANPSQPG